jgi:hypothetical protein
MGGEREVGWGTVDTPSAAKLLPDCVAVSQEGNTSSDPLLLLLTH